jgi:hypothetical protein
VLLLDGEDAVARSERVQHTGGVVLLAAPDRARQKDATLDRSDEKLPRELARFRIASRVRGSGALLPASRATVIAMIGAAAVGLHVPMTWRSTADLDLVLAVGWVPLLSGT